MAAPRKYSDAQRQAMYRLYEVGKSPGEIASLCKQGMAGVAPFQIPRRTAHEILTRMADEAEQKLPTSVAEAESAEAVERHPVRIATVVDREISRLDQKQAKGGLRVGDLDLLAKLADLSFALHKRLSKRPAAAGRTGATRQVAGERREPEGAIEKLAREQAERAGREVQLKDAPTCPDDDSEHPESADLPTPTARLSPIAQAALVPVEEPQRTAAEKTEAAQKAREALALS
ncbi:MAG: hypothetical protein ACRDLL_03335 [Solirubrobacterales bacterium]